MVTPLYRGTWGSEVSSYIQGHTDSDEPKAIHHGYLLVERHTSGLIIPVGRELTPLELSVQDMGSHSPRFD